MDKEKAVEIVQEFGAGFGKLLSEIIEDNKKLSERIAKLEEKQT